MKGFSLGADELGVLADPAREGALHLDDLPVHGVADPAARRALFTAWTEWYDYADLRTAAVADPSALPAALRDAPPAGLVLATGWDTATVAGFGLAAGDYRDPHRLRTLAQGMRLLATLGASAEQGLRWADPLPSREASRVTARETWHALKAGYDDETWAEVARTPADALREAQRAALVAYLLPSSDSPTRMSCSRSS